MNKPETGPLKHQQMLESAITRIKDHSTLSAWWLCLPLYVLAMLFMKTLYVPESTLISNLADLQARQPLLSVLMFVLVPIGSIILNIVSIKRLLAFSGARNVNEMPLFALLPMLMVIVSILILIVYTL